MINDNIDLAIVQPYHSDKEKVWIRKDSIFDVTHPYGVQHERYLKASCIIGRNISVWLGILHCLIVCH